MSDINFQASSKIRNKAKSLFEAGDSEAIGQPYEQQGDYLQASVSTILSANRMPGLQLEVHPSPNYDSNDGPSKVSPEGGGFYYKGSQQELCVTVRQRRTEEEP